MELCNRLHKIGHGRVWCEMLKCVDFHVSARGFAKSVIFAPMKKPEKSQTEPAKSREGEIPGGSQKKIGFESSQDYAKGVKRGLNRAFQPK